MKVIVFIDVQNDFVKGGALPYAYPEEPNHQKIIEFAKKCRARGHALFATVDTHMPPDDKNQYGYNHTLEGKLLPIAHCIVGTDGHKIIDGLVKDKNHNVIIPQSRIIDKGSFGALGLDELIKCHINMLNEPIEEIVVCGYCTSISVVSNALMLRAQFTDTPVTVIGELCGDIDRESHFAALKVMHNCMVFNKSPDCILEPQDASS